MATSNGCIGQANDDSGGMIPFAWFTSSLESLLLLLAELADEHSSSESHAF